MQSTQRFSYTFFLGFDQGDALYDTGDAWSDMRQGFNGASVNKTLDHTELPRTYGDV